MPKRKGVVRKLFRRPINHLDIHWRNTALLTKFMTGTSTIRTRYSTGLPKWQQKKVANAIQNARKMNLIPYAGFMKSYHKSSLKSIHDDIENTTIKRVDLETGAVKLVQPTTTWKEHREYTNEEFARLDHYNEEVDVSSYNLSNYTFLTKDQQSVIQAQRYANYVKEQKLKAGGIDPKTYQQRYEQDHASIDNLALVNMSTADTLEEDKKSYEAVKVGLFCLTIRLL
jgi:ribosomal protein S18